MNSPFTKDELKRQLDGILEFDFRTEESSGTQIVAGLLGVFLPLHGVPDGPLPQDQPLQPRHAGRC